DGGRMRARWPLGCGVGGSVGGTSARGGSGGGGAVRAVGCGAVRWPLSPLNCTLVPTRVGSPITATCEPLVVTDTDVVVSGRTPSAASSAPIMSRQLGKRSSGLTLV